MIVCKKCGNQNEEGATFCGSCGAFLEWLGEKITDPTDVAGEQTTAMDLSEIIAEPESPPELAVRREPAPEAVPEPEPESEPASLAADSTKAMSIIEPITEEVQVPQDEDTSDKQQSVLAEAETPAPPSVAAVPTPPVAAPKRPPRPKKTGADDVAATVPAKESRSSDAPEQGEAKASSPALQREFSAPHDTLAPRSPSAPQARKPAPAKARPPAKTPAPARIINPGDLVCGQCGEGNDPSRKFCRKCGASLVEAVVAPAGPRPPWWKRIFRRQQHAMRAGERSSEAVSDATRRAGSTILKVAAATAIIVGGIVALPKLKDVVNNKTEPVKPTTITATSQAKGHDPRLAVDGFKNTYWAENVKGDGVNQAISFSFDDPVHLVWVLITAGAQKTAQPRPRLILITFYDANGRAIDARSTTLPDTSDPHKLRVSIAGVKRVEIKISSVYVAANKRGSTLSISEVEFERKA